MKKLLPAATLLLFQVTLNAQDIKKVSISEYDIIKKNGLATTNYRIETSSQNNITTIIQPSVDEIDTIGSGCSCLIPLDGTFSLVPFQGYSSPYRNDDGSAQISIPFSFNFYGNSYNSLYINNNGNISFGNSYATFNASGFPSSFVMIAPFWGDVDTRNASSGLVHYKVTNDYLIVKWENVGYYNSHSDKRNTFQLIISTGTDSLLPGNNNVAFCYGDMQWTGGDATQGVNGFGGIPTTVGTNKGDAVNFAQIARNDTSGYGYDGPNGLNDGVDWLDNKSFFLDVSSVNTPPIAYDSICDTLIPVFDSIGDPFRVFFNSLDANENITHSIVNQPVGMFIDTFNLGNTTELSFRFYPVNTGLQTLSVNYTDSGHPGITYNYSKTFNVQSVSTAVGMNKVNAYDYKVYPNPAKNKIHFEFNERQKHLITLSDLTGRIVVTYKLNESENSISIEGIKPGIYFLTIENQLNIAKITKLIIE